MKIEFSPSSLSTHQRKIFVCERIPISKVLQFYCNNIQLSSTLILNEKKCEFILNPQLISEGRERERERERDGIIIFAMCSI
jgi:hypothetical protein